MVKKIGKAILYLGAGFCLVYWLKDPIISIVIGLLVIIAVEVLDMKFGKK